MHNPSLGSADPEPASELQVNSNKGLDYVALPDEPSCLSVLPTMPLDILYEIFEWTDPMDLLHLARTSKSLRGLLMNRDSAFLWKSTLKRYKSFPECPLGIAEPLWVDLVCSPFNCYICGAGDALPDFSLLIRLCQECMDNELVAHDDKAYPGISIQSNAWNLVPYTRRGSSRNYRFPSVSRYRLSELQDTEAKLMAYETEIKLQRPGAETALEDFIALKKSLVSSAVEYSGKYRKWADVLASDHEERQLQRRRESVAPLKACFLELEYHKDDIESSLCRPLRFPQGNHQRILRGWDAVKPTIERQLVEFQHSRVVLDRANIIWGFGAIVPDHEVKVYKPFAKLIHAPSNATLGEAERREATSIFPSFIAEWISEKRQDLEMMLPVHDLPNAAQPCSLGGSVGNSAEIVPGDADVRSLDLATSVFLLFCGSQQNKECSQLLIAWEDAGRCLQRYSSRLEATLPLRFSQRGFDAAASLISLVGLDLAKTLPNHLDKLDSRFLCSNCPIEQYRGVMGRKVYTWRDCVFHFIETEDSKPEMHTLPSWLLLTPEATADVRRREGNDPRLEDRMWCCNHCPAHFDGLVKRSEVVKHLWIEHRIARPESGQDLVYSGSLPRVRRPVGFAESPPADYCCNRCPPASNRLFKLRDIKQHLPDVHQVQEYILDQDYSKVKTILRSPTAEPEAQS